MSLHYKITLIKGDGIGNEVITAAKRCIEATNINIDWEEVIAGEEAIEKYNDPLPKIVLDSIKKNKVCLKGPITTPIGYGFRSVNVRLRQELDLFACIRPIKSFKNTKCIADNIDIIIIRENKEDLYSGIEFEEGKEETTKLIEFIKKTKNKEILNDSGISIKNISRTNSNQIVRFAFEYALKNNRKKVTVCHKANILKYSDGLFLDVARKIAKNYPQIEFEDKLIDNLCMQLVQKPHLYDIIVLPNLYGDIVSDLCAGLVGGLGFAPSVNIGSNYAVFEPTHGSAPKYKGQNKVNPISAILSGCLMLKYLGRYKEAKMIEVAIEEVLQEGKYLTYDIVGEDKACKNYEMVDEIVRKISDKK